MRQKEYYTEPRFHASVAWALLDRQPRKSFEENEIDLDAQFPTIPSFPPSLVQDLTSNFGVTLSKLGIFQVTQVSIRIGKDVFSFLLRG